MRETRAWECFLLWEKLICQMKSHSFLKPAKPAVLPKSSSAGLAALFQIMSNLCDPCKFPANYIWHLLFKPEVGGKRAKESITQAGFIYIHTEYSDFARASVDISCRSCAPSPRLTCGRAIYKWRFLRPPEGNIYFFSFLSARWSIKAACLKIRLVMANPLE